MTGMLVCDPADPQWLEKRRAGITASDMPVILGLVSWDSPWALYHRKRGDLPEVEQTDRMRLGSWLEQAIITTWREQTGLGAWKAGLYQSDNRPWQMATPDAQVGPQAGPDAVLECKTASSRDSWGDQGSSQVPAYVRAQVLWQMDVMGVATGHVAVCFLPSGEFRSYTIRHAETCDPTLSDKIADFERCEACQDTLMMRAAGAEFLARIQGELPAPPVDHLTATTKALQAVYAGFSDTETAELDGNLARDWADARDDYKAAQDHKTELDNQVREALGKAGTGTVGGVPVIRRQVSKRAGYDVPPGVQDKLIRVKGQDDG